MINKGYKRKQNDLTPLRRTEFGFQLPTNGICVTYLLAWNKLYELVSNKVGEQLPKGI
jgi:hypothetical protein